MDALEAYEKKVVKLLEKRDKVHREISCLIYGDIESVLESCNCGGSIDFSYGFHGSYYILNIYPKSENHQMELAINFFKRIATRLDQLLIVNTYKPLDQLSKEVDQRLVEARARIQARQPIIYRRNA